MEDIKTLKKIGHDLLNEYIALDNIRTPNSARKHAYQKLADKMRREEPTVHFNRLNTQWELLEAIQKLNKMIRKRIIKNQLYAKEKTEFAPNVVELQRGIKFEKIG